MNEVLLIYVLLLGAAVMACVLASWLVCRFAINRRLLYDDVTDRSSHHEETSRAGGVAIFLPFILITAVWVAVIGNQNPVTIWILLGLTAGATLLGLADDFVRLPPAAKFLGQVALATLATLLIGQIETFPLPFLGDVSLGTTGFFMTVLWIIAFINTFNFMDGLNGLAAGAAIVALLAMALASASTGRMDIFVLCICLAASTLGFLHHNFPSGLIFMGDAGSHGFGFFLAVLAVIASKSVEGEGSSVADFVFLPIIFLPFILDVTVTLVSRAFRRRRLHRAHKEHVYQKLNQRGLDHGTVAGIYIGLCLVSAITAWLVGYVDPAHKWLGPFILTCFLGAGGFAFFTQNNKLDDNSGSSGD